MASYSEVGIAAVSHGVVKCCGHSWRRSLIWALRRSVQLVLQSSTCLIISISYGGASSGWLFVDFSGFHKVSIMQWNSDDPNSDGEGFLSM